MVIRNVVPGIISTQSMFAVTTVTTTPVITITTTSTVTPTISIITSAIIITIFIFNTSTTTIINIGQPDWLFIQHCGVQSELNLF